MTTPGHERTAGYRETPRKAGNIWALTLAATLPILGGLGIRYWSDTFDQGELNQPTQQVRHDPEDLAPGLDAYAGRHRSPNHHRILVQVKMGDILPWLEHLDNVSAHQGWYTTSKARTSRNLILPGGQVNDLWNAKDAPTGG